MVSNPIVLTSEPAAVSTSGPKPTWEARDGSPFVEIFNQEVRKEITYKTTSFSNPDRPHSRDKVFIPEEVAVESDAPVRNDDPQPASNWSAKGNQQEDASVDIQLGVVQAVISGQLIVATALPQSESVNRLNADAGANATVTASAIGQVVAQAIASELAPGTLTTENQMKAGANSTPVGNNNLDLNNPEINLQVQVPTKFPQVLANAQTQAITPNENTQASEIASPPANNPGAKATEDTQPVIANAKAAVEQIIATRANSQSSTGAQASESGRSLLNPRHEQSLGDSTTQSQTVQSSQANINQTPQTVSSTSQTANTQTLAGSLHKASLAKESADPPVQPSTNKITSGAEIAETSKTIGAPSGIRLSEPARPAEARSQHPVLQVANQLENMAASGIKTLRMQLYPEALGKLELQLTSQGGTLKVVILADQASSQQTLERHAQDLQQALQQHGINLTGLTIGQRGVGDQTGKEQPQAYNNTPNKSLLKDQPDQDMDANETLTKVTRPSISPNSASSLEYWI